MNLNNIPKDGYKIILADPPWAYDNEKSNDPAMGGITYPVMAQSDLCSLPVNDISAKDSLLFLWGTAPKLPECLEVMQAWNFKFCTMPFIWIKLNPTGSVEYSGKDLTIKKGIYSGLGSYTCSCSEYLIMGKKGKGVPRITKSIKQAILAPRGRHSQKPEELQDRLELLFGDVPRIELFATRERQNWLCIGNEINGENISDELKIIIDNLAKK